MQFLHIQVLQSPHGTVGQCAEKHSCRIFPPSQKAQQQSRYSVDLHSSAKFLKKHNSSRVSDPLESVSKPLAFFSLSSIVLSVGRALSPGFALGAGGEPARAPSDTMGQVLQMLSVPCPRLWLYDFRVLQPSSNSQYLHFCVQAFFF